MKINEAGLNLIKQFEQCRLDSYQDIVGIWTIGWGSTGDDIGPEMSWTQEQCDERLLSDISKFESGVSGLLKVDINENEFSALVCFSYNVGLNALAHSHLLSKINVGDPTAKDEFIRWDRAGGVVVPGLLRRREAEVTLFVS